ncbi:MAG: Eco57I restriction-modification methylase domain-containing protein [Ardenticatenaceae bacterium]|nr:Eco57I restriction-modification methylase domain-containing protein [Ardenticatenaceae bacterium]
MNTTHARRYLRQFDFRSLFVEELGWDNYQISLTISVDDNHYVLQGAAEKRGMVVLVAYLSGEIPLATIRNKIEQQVAQKYREHILIFADGTRTRQTWLWVRRELGRPLARRSHEYDIQQPGDSLLQKLATIAFSFEDEEGLTLVDVTSRVRAAFNVERATRRFYDEFKKERNAFEKFVLGIPDVDMSKWYVSVMLNRLMFVYFIQRKGFLDGDQEYLRNRLRLMRERYGQDQFYSFYRTFLLRLFHEGLGEPAHNAELEALIGKVPYLNGGIFQLHQVEQTYPDIQISDAAFIRIFDFFDQYQWHLDDRPLRDDREINPDVLGYIFEKYINQKQMGAYYTKEDITEYISKNTIIPFLFDQARQDCAIAFTADGPVWSLPQADPNRYIYEAVQHGADHPLPPEIAAGIDDVAQRDQWNTPTPDPFALPTEIWRETVARRQRYEEVRGKLAAGEVTEINDFITLNLDIQQLAQDVIENSEGADLLSAFWKALTTVSVLDPTCGSGAFLFAALTILQPLYEAAIERMHAFMAEPEWMKLHPRYAERFGGVLADIDRHPNLIYFVLKSIVVNNLYGVDIMPEAVEIAKLRLFLKLTAQVTRVEDIEPLPDIDFNIRAGNTLVGFTSKEEVAKALRMTQTGQTRIVFGEDEAALAAIEEKAGDIDRLFTHFRAMQTSSDQREFDAADFVATKQRLQSRLRELEDELNRLIARQYGVKMEDGKAYQKWLTSHQPFHWFTEFYGILKQGGFDVIIGNPPYVEYRKVSNIYSVREYITEDCRNLYAFVIENCFALLNVKGQMGHIIPMPAINTSRMSSLQSMLRTSDRTIWISSFDERPSNLFSGVDQRLSILLLSKRKQKTIIYTTGINRWNSTERNSLFHLLFYATITPSNDFNESRILKAKHPIENSILNKFLRHKPISILRVSSPQKENELVAYRTAGGRYWKVFLNHPFPTESLSNKVAYFLPHVNSSTMMAVLSSNLFWWYYSLNFDMYNLKDYMIFDFRFDYPTVDSNLRSLGTTLALNLEATARQTIITSKTRGEVISKLYVVSHSKHLIDQIDEELAQHYGFNDEELDFIINYDIKYRMGDDLFTDDEDGDDT